MLRFLPSIRQKILVGFYGTVAIILIMSLFTFIDLNYMERKIAVGEVISAFFDITLEIRRFEKNFFLYGKEDDYRENRQYVLQAEELLRENAAKFSTLMVPGQSDSLRNNLHRYRELMDRFFTLSLENGRRVSTRMTILENSIRKTGKDITTVAEAVARAERRHLQQILHQSRRLLIFSMVALSLVAIIVGQMLTRLIVRPLKSLEERMAAIAAGKFEPIAINSRDREIISLTNAFNKMLQEREVRQKHLIRSEKLASLGTLLSGVAHELNNPLSNISTSAQILSEEIAEGDLEYKKELLSQIEEQTERARNIVRSLLEFSRSRDFRKEQHPLRTIVDETIRFLKGQIPTRVEIVLDIPEDVEIFADRQRIQQVFLNLIKNAIESLQDDGKITIVARKQAGGEPVDFVDPALFSQCSIAPEASEDAVCIKICDTGGGIPADILPRIFDPFFTTREVGKGSGLGLSIVHEIIGEHGGCIAVDSEPGVGTTFLIRLPARPAAAGSTDAAPQEKG